MNVGESGWPERTQAEVEVMMAEKQVSSKELRRREERMLDAVRQAGGELRIAGIVDCRTAIRLIGDGKLRITGGSVGPLGGTAWVAMPLPRNRKLR